MTDTLYTSNMAMQSSRPSCKRAGPSIEATYSHVDQRVKLSPSEVSNRQLISCRECYINKNTRSKYQSVPAKINVNGCHGHSDQLQQPETVHITHVEETRDEFPFPKQPLAPARVNYLSLDIPSQDPDMDVALYDANEHSQSPTLPCPPRSHPTVPTLFSTSPPSASYLPSSPPPPPPSLDGSSPWTPTSPPTPQTPASVFSLAAQSLKQLLLADELGMTIDELKELGEFAAQRVSGSSKRSGRILPIRPLKEFASLEGDDDAKTDEEQSQRQQYVERWAQDAGVTEFETEDRWRAINWSQFSDCSSDVSSSDDDLFFDPDQGPLGECGVCETGDQVQCHCFWNANSTATYNPGEKSSEEVKQRFSGVQDTDERGQMWSL